MDDPQWHELDLQRRQQTLEAVKRLLLRESQMQPLLLLFEDLHWIDAGTQAFLDSLVESLPTAAVLLLVNYRPEYQHSWGSKTYYATPPRPLAAESAEELLQALVGDDASVQALKRLLIARTEGNPFFWKRTCAPWSRRQPWLGSAAPIGWCRISPRCTCPYGAGGPGGAHRPLAPEEKRLLQTAAVLGKDVPFALLQAIADYPRTALR